MAAISHFLLPIHHLPTFGLRSHIIQLRQNSLACDLRHCGELGNAKELAQSTRVRFGGRVICL